MAMAINIGQIAYSLSLHACMDFSFAKAGLSVANKH